MNVNVSVSHTKKRRQSDADSIEASPKKRVRIEEPFVKSEPTAAIMTETKSEPSAGAVVVVKPSNKIKKKFSLILSGMLKLSKPRDVCKEKEALRKGLGGGTFTKVDKI